MSLNFSLDPSSREVMRPAPVAEVSTEPLPYALSALLAPWSDEVNPRSWIELSEAEKTIRDYVQSTVIGLMTGLSPEQEKGLLSFAVMWVGDRFGGRSLQLARDDTHESQALFIDLARVCMYALPDQLGPHAEHFEEMWAAWKSSLSALADLEKSLLDAGHQGRSDESELSDVWAEELFSVEEPSKRRKTARKTDPRDQVILDFIGKRSLLTVSLKAAGTMGHAIVAELKRRPLSESAEPLQQMGWSLRLWNSGDRAVVGPPKECLAQVEFQILDDRHAALAIDCLLAAEEAYFADLYRHLGSLSYPLEDLVDKTKDLRTPQEKRQHIWTEAQREKKIVCLGPAHAQHSGSCVAKSRRLWLKLSALEFLDPSDRKTVLALLDLMATLILENGDPELLPNGLTRVRSWCSTAAAVQRLTNSMRDQAQKREGLDLAIALRRMAVMSTDAEAHSQMDAVWEARPFEVGAPPDFNPQDKKPGGASERSILGEDLSAIVRQTIENLAASGCTQIDKVKEVSLRLAYSYLDFDGRPIHATEACLALGQCVAMARKCLSTRFKGDKETKQRLVPILHSLLRLAYDAIDKRSRIGREGDWGLWDRAGSWIHGLQPVCDSDQSAINRLCKELNHHLQGVCIYTRKSKKTFDFETDVRLRKLVAEHSNLEDACNALVEACCGFGGVTHAGKWSGRDFWRQIGEFVQVWQRVCKPAQNSYAVRTTAGELNQPNALPHAVGRHWVNHSKIINGARAMDSLGASVLLAAGSVAGNPLAIANDLANWDVPFSERAEGSPDHRWWSLVGMEALIAWINAVKRHVFFEGASKLQRGEVRSIEALSERLIGCAEAEPRRLELWQSWSDLLSLMIRENGWLSAWFFVYRVRIHLSRGESVHDVTTIFGREAPLLGSLQGNLFSPLGLHQHLVDVMADLYRARELTNCERPEQFVIQVEGQEVGFNLLTGALLGQEPAASRRHRALKECFEQGKQPAGWKWGEEKAVFRPQGVAEVSLRGLSRARKTKWDEPEERWEWSSWSEFDNGYCTGLIVEIKESMDLDPTGRWEKKLSIKPLDCPFGTLGAPAVAENAAVVVGCDPSAELIDYRNRLPGIFSRAAILVATESSVGFGLQKLDTNREIARLEIARHSSDRPPVLRLVGREPIPLTREWTNDRLVVVGDSDSGRGVLRDYLWNGEPLEIHCEEREGDIQLRTRDGWHFDQSQQASYDLRTRRLVEQVEEWDDVIMEYVNRENVRGVLVAAIDCRTMKTDLHPSYDFIESRRVGLAPPPLYGQSSSTKASLGTAILLIETATGSLQLPPEQEVQSIIEVLNPVSKVSPLLAKELLSLLVKQQPQLSPLQFARLSAVLIQMWGSGILLQPWVEHLTKFFSDRALKEILSADPSTDSIEWPPGLRNWPSWRDGPSFFSNPAPALKHFRSNAEAGWDVVDAGAEQVRQILSQLPAGQMGETAVEHALRQTQIAVDTIIARGREFLKGLPPYVKASLAARFGLQFTEVLLKLSTAQHQSGFKSQLLQNVMPELGLSENAANFALSGRLMRAVVLSSQVQKFATLYREFRALHPSEIFLCRTLGAGGPPSHAPGGGESEQPSTRLSRFDSVQLSPLGRRSWDAFDLQSGEASWEMNPQDWRAPHYGLHEDDFSASWGMMVDHDLSEWDQLAKQCQAPPQSHLEFPVPEPASKKQCVERSQPMSEQAKLLANRLRALWRIIGQTNPAGEVLDPSFEFLTGLHRTPQQADILNGLNLGNGPPPSGSPMAALVKAEPGSGKTSVINPAALLALSRRFGPAFSIVPDSMEEAAFRDAQRLGRQLFDEPPLLLRRKDHQSVFIASVTAAVSNRRPVVCSASAWHFQWLGVLQNLLSRWKQPNPETNLFALPITMLRSPILIDEADELLRTDLSYNLSVEQAQTMPYVMSWALRRLHTWWKDHADQALVDGLPQRDLEALLREASPPDWTPERREPIIRALITKQPVQHLGELKENQDQLAMIAWLATDVLQTARGMKYELDYGPSGPAEIDIVPYQKAHWPSDQRFSNPGLEAILMMQMLSRPLFWNQERAKQALELVESAARQDEKPIAELLGCPFQQSWRGDSASFLQELREPETGHSLRVALGLLVAQKKVMRRGRVLRSYASASMLRSCMAVASTGTPPAARLLPTRLQHAHTEQRREYADSLKPWVQGTVVHAGIFEAIQAQKPHILLDPNGLLSSEEAITVLNEMARGIDPDRSQQLLQLTWTKGNAHQPPALARIQEDGKPVPPPSEEIIARRKKVVVYQQAQCRGADLKPGAAQEIGLLYLKEPILLGDLLQTVGRLRGLKGPEGNTLGSQELWIALHPDLFHAAQQRDATDPCRGLWLLCEELERNQEPRIQAELLRQELAGMRQILVALRVMIAREISQARGDLTSLEDEVESLFDRFEFPDLPELMGGEAGRPRGRELLQRELDSLQALFTPTTRLMQRLERDAAVKNSKPWGAILAVHNQVVADFQSWKKRFSELQERDLHVLCGQADKEIVMEVVRAQETNRSREGEKIAEIDHLSSQVEEPQDFSVCSTIDLNDEGLISGLIRDPLPVERAGVQVLAEILAAAGEEVAAPLLDPGASARIQYSRAAFEPIGCPLPLRSAKRIDPLLLTYRTSAGFQAILLGPQEVGMVLTHPAWKTVKESGDARVYTLHGMALQGALGMGQDRSEAEMAQADPAWHRFLCEALQDLRKVRALFGVAIPKFDRHFFEQEREWLRSNRGWHTLWVAASSEEERIGRLRFMD